MIRRRHAWPLAALMALLAACSPPRGRVAAIVDEAFVTARPGLAANLEAGIRGPLPFLSRAGLAVVSLDRGTEGLMVAARQAGFGPAGAFPGNKSTEQDRPAALVTSPLFAAALLAGESGLSGPSAAGTSGIKALGGALLVVPEWRKGPHAGVFPVDSDYLPAFAAAGRAAGAYVAALQASGEASAAGAILFRASEARGGEALDAFSAAFRQSAGFPPLVEELRAPDEAAAVEAIEAAVARLLSADLRVVLVAAGPQSSTACGRLARPGLAIGIEGSEASDFPAADFGILPDDAGLAAAAILAATSLGEGGRAAGSGRLLPAILVAYPRSQAGLKAQKTKDGADLAQILATYGATKAKSPEKRTSKR